jgi:putative heme-binding domain-containing protein
VAAQTKKKATNPLRKETATPSSLVKAKKGFQVELLYTVPKEKQGSWVSLCVDPKGRLIASDQGSTKGVDAKLYRITPPPIGGKAEDTKVEALPVDLGEAQGLVWAYDSLYVVVNRSRRHDNGLYRVRSSRNDDVLDTKELLRKLPPGGGEHGPHAVMPGPDGKSLYVVCGNHTDVTTLAGSRVPKVWGEDFLVPRLWDATGHAVGRMAPAGCIYRVDPDGQNWELVSIGYRNEYDAAFNRDGELFAFDADMEWDMSLPWYRPTRVCHAVDGSEFGWRGGTGKMYEYMPDNLPPVVNVGPGSPTGVCFGYGAKFPAKYQDALYLCDWSFGKLYAAHIKPSGASYTAELEDFVNGSPLPLTDITVNPKDGALYFTTGGRNTLSGLYRLTYVGAESTAPAPPDKTGAEQRAIRKKLEALYGKNDPQAAAIAWPYLGDSDRFLRFAARSLLEFQDPQSWQEKALAEAEPVALTNAMIGLARASCPGPAGDVRQTFKERDVDWPRLSAAERIALLRALPKTLPNDSADKVAQLEKGLAAAPKLQPRMLKALERVDWSKLTQPQKIDYLRAYQLVFVRLGTPDPIWKQKVGSRLDAFYPADDRNVNAELCKLICYLEPLSGVAKTMSLLAKAPSQEEQIEYALSLRTVKQGWTKQLHEDYFNWFQKAANYRGGHSFHGFMRNIRRDAIASLSAAERTDLAQVLEHEPQPKAPKFIFKQRPLVKKYTVSELVPIVEKGLHDRNYERGRNLFGEAKCFVCHRFASDGGGLGPDLTQVAGRFGVRDLLESIIEPSKVISDQYQAIVATTSDGKQYIGRIINLHGDTININTDMLDPDKIAPVNRNLIDSVEPSPRE